MPRLSATLRAALETALGLAIVTALFLAGSGLHRIGVPLPGGVLGLLLFFAALLTGALKLHWVQRGANLLLRHMVLLFIPLTVGLMDFGSLLRRNALAILASLVVSFLAVLFTTGLLGRWLLPASESTEGVDL